MAAFFVMFSKEHIIANVDWYNKWHGASNNCNGSQFVLNAHFKLPVLFVDVFIIPQKLENKEPLIG